jgi:hypothetical protein
VALMVAPLELVVHIVVLPIAAELLLMEALVELMTEDAREPV